jgi:hypothetical protein
MHLRNEISRLGDGALSGAYRFLWAGGSTFASGTDAVLAI